MANFKKSPMEKVGEIVSDKITEIAQKTTKRNNSGEKNTALIKVNNSRPSLIEEATEYFNEVTKFISDIEEYNHNIERLANQITVTIEQVRSQDNVYRQHISFSTKEVLKHGFSFLEHNLTQLNSEVAKEIVDRFVPYLSKSLNFYRGLVSSEEYLSLTGLIKPEIFDKIQNYGNVKQQ